MSLAPASSRGCFLKARLAVNGIQCAARSFGTLTGVGRGLLSSMVASSIPELFVRRVSVSPYAGNALIRHLKVGCADPEHFALGILGIQPEQRHLRVGRFQQFAAAA